MLPSLNVAESIFDSGLFTVASASFSSMKNNAEAPPSTSKRFRPPFSSKKASISVPLIWSKWVESSWMVMKAFDMRLAFSIAPSLTTTLMLSAVY